MMKKCEHCKKRGHTVDECFKLVGYPEWFKNPGKGKESFKYAANVGKEECDFDQDEPLENYGSGNGKEAKPDSKLVTTMVQEMMKMMNAQQQRKLYWIFQQQNGKLCRYATS